MMMIVLIAAALLGSPSPEMTHSVTLNQAGAPVPADYRAVLDIRTQERGMSLGPRPSTSQCQWQSFAHVTRTVADSNLPVREFTPVAVGSGFRAGGCLETRNGIKADAARQHHKVGQVLIEAAARDKATLLAEAGGMSRLASGN